MKKFFVFCLPFLLFFACEEIPPNLGTVGVTPDPVSGVVLKNVLIEEFTGVRCVNCPAGSEVIETLINLHGDRLVAVSIHAGDFAVPYSESVFDFKINDGESLLNFLDQPQGFPTAVVNRKLFDGEQDLQLPKSNWAGFIEQELAREASVSIALTAEVNDSGLLQGKADIIFLDSFDGESPKFTLLVTESNMVDPQETPSGKVSDYKHKHVLRDIITPFDGEDISPAIGTVVSKEFSMPFPGDWNLSELTLIAIIHNSGVNKEIHQVQSLEF